MTPSEVRVIKVEPDSLVLSFSKRVEKRVPIAPVTDITPGGGYVLIGKPVASPATVVISGAQSILDSITSFPTKLVLFHDAKQDVERTIALSDSLDNYVTVARDAPVTVRADVQAIGERTIGGLVTGVDALPPSIDVLLIPNAVALTLRGGVDQLASLKPTEVRVHIPFDPILFDTARSLAPTVEVPEGVQLLSVDPPRVKFIIRRKPVAANATR
jgi:YbbR domain-containing protein